MALQAPTVPLRKRGAAPGRSAASGTGGRTAAIFLVPFFAVFAIAMVAPVIYSIVLSFYAQQKSGLGFGEAKTVFVGLENYFQVLASESFVSGIARLGLYCLIYIPVMVGSAVVFALLLDATVARARKLFQLLVFLPHAVPGVIAALIWAYLYTPGISPLVQALQGGGIQINFLDAHLVLPAIVNIGVWGLGHRLTDLQPDHKDLVSRRRHHELRHHPDLWHVRPAAAIPTPCRPPENW